MSQFMNYTRSMNSTVTYLDGPLWAMFYDNLPTPVLRLQWGEAFALLALFAALRVGCVFWVGGRLGENVAGEGVFFGWSCS